ncbi:TPA: LysM peptidoglycan-binding domain-containing protein [Legionella pneumophila]|uniref:LysM peptidoglycan-binding domain-containing protein n=1 Tax=Legionella pneumophila TaxID=446 RepID=A0AAN5KRU6_LEGPN|nr:LysM peptidoglycan-binding domain-containing protein [Legionella pneumophila]HAT1971405.1 LysM peptidoglycan-binding domain-containing protein [Legionella pneumophila]HAT6956747.1 LysM peptidoglycan-binding domain-containing protein [Legionella pneumophila]HEN4771350.1 LysM peptidoglycan-binding domain-containing protein [Legionella pneumophila]
MKYCLLIFCLIISSIAHALSLRPDSPSRYVVQPGDTLWSISSRYLNNPWEWKALWRANPQIQNPDRLYPGAVLALEYYQNIPYLRVLSNGTIKLSPNIRVTPQEDAVPPIPLGDIKPFLDESLILDVNVLSRAPYVVALMSERMLGGQGDEIYVRGLHPSKEMPQGGTIGYSIFRGGRNYFDPITHELLGYKAVLVGYGELVAGGEPATVLLTSINQGIKINDKVLINNHPEFELYFEPETPARQVRGYIIEMPDNMPAGNTQEAVGGVIIINLGETSGMKPGDVLAIYGKERIVNDPQNHLRPITLPQERLGEAMVFRVFTKASYALIVRSTRAIHLLDTVTNP